MPPAMHIALYPNRRSGTIHRPILSLVGVLSILAFVAIALAVVYPKSGSSGPYARHTAAVTFLENFKTALEAFRRDTGFYPKGTNGLLDLVNQPEGVTNWKGPYLRDVPLDPWKRDYMYACPGKHTASGYPYDLYSLGPSDKTSVIANWTFENMKP
jgi:general secretion pathway protein G